MFSSNALSLPVKLLAGREFPSKFLFKRLVYSVRITHLQHPFSKSRNPRGNIVCVGKSYQSSLARQNSALLTRLA